MANINVRGLSDRTKEALRVRAAQAGMSLEAFARRTLQKAVVNEGEEPPSIVDVAARYFGAESGIELTAPGRATRRKPVEFS